MFEYRAINITNVQPYQLRASSTFVERFCSRQDGVKSRQKSTNLPHIQVIIVQLFYRAYETINKETTNNIGSSVVPDAVQGLVVMLTPL